MALATDPVTLALATKATREANAIGCPHPSKLPVWHSLRSPWLPLFYALSPGQMVVGPDYSLPECVLGQLAAARWSQELQRSLVLAEGGPDVIMHGAKGLLIGRVVPSSLGHPILEPILGHSDSLSQELVLLNLCRTSLGALCSVVASRLRSSNGYACSLLLTTTLRAEYCYKGWTLPGACRPRRSRALSDTPWSCQPPACLSMKLPHTSVLTRTSLMTRTSPCLSMP